MYVFIFQVATKQFLGYKEFLSCLALTPTQNWRCFFWPMSVMINLMRQGLHKLRSLGTLVKSTMFWSSMDLIGTWSHCKAYLSLGFDWHGFFSLFTFPSWKASITQGLSSHTPGPVPASVPLDIFHSVLMLASFQFLKNTELMRRTLVCSCPGLPLVSS
jgi:hypothetical protein